MKDNQKKYLDRVVDLIVRDTRIGYDEEIDYDEELVFYPFFLTPFSFTHPYLFSHYLFPSYFSMYCKDTYGLGEEEIDYVWDQYRVIIKDKIK